MTAVRKPWLLPMCALALACLVTTPALAHDVNFSRGDYRPAPDGAEAWIAMARPDFVLLLPQLDANKDGTLDDAEIVMNDDAAARLLALITAERGGVPCAGKVERIETSGPDGGLFEIQFGPCSGDAAELTLQLGPALAAISSGHRHTAFVHAPDSEAPKDAIVYGKQASVVVPVGPPERRSEQTSYGPRPRQVISSFSGAVGLGFRRFFSSVDPSLFLLGLVAVVLGHTSDASSRSTKRLLGSSLAMFVAAHSLTLALSILGTYTPRALVVRSLCALSLTYIGLDTVFLRPRANVTRPTLPPDTWMIAGAFGLMHGFALAALSAPDLAIATLSPPSLLSGFNLGVELATLGVMAVLVPLALLLRSRGLASRRTLLPAGMAIAALGLYCFVRRVAS